MNNAINATTSTPTLIAQSRNRRLDGVLEVRLDAHSAGEPALVLFGREVVVERRHPAMAAAGRSHRLAVSGKRLSHGRRHDANTEPRMVDGFAHRVDRLDQPTGR